MQILTVGELETLKKHSKFSLNTPRIKADSKDQEIGKLLQALELVQGVLAKATYCDISNDRLGRQALRDTGWEVQGWQRAATLKKS